MLNPKSLSTRFNGEIIVFIIFISFSFLEKKKIVMWMFHNPMRGEASKLVSNFQYQNKQTKNTPIFNKKNMTKYSESKPQAASKT